jgi:hypothetical protein
MADVTIEIGAKIDKLVEGVDAARGQIDRLNGYVAGVGETFRHMGELIGVSLSFAGLVEFVEKMAAIGTAAERTHAQLGISTDAIIRLQGVAAATGTDFGTLQLGIERISLNVQRATKDAFDPVNAALKVLGLTTRDLLNLPADQYFNKIAGAVSKLEPSLNRTNAVMQIGGRGIAQMLPLLDKGSDFIKKFGDEWMKAASGIDVTKFESTHVAIALLERSVQSLGEKIFAVLQPAINTAITLMTQWVQTLTIDDIKNATKAIVDYTVQAIQSIAGVVLFLKEAIEDLSTDMGRLKQLAADAALGGLLTSLLGKGVLPGALAGLGVGQVLNMIDDYLNKPLEQGTKTFEERSQALVDRVKKFAETLKTAITAADVAQAAPHDTKAAAAAMNLSARLEADMARIRIETQRGGLQQQLDQSKLYLQAQVDLERMFGSQRVVAVAQVTDQIYQKDVALLEKERALYPQRTLEWAKINAQIIALQQKHQTEMLQLHYQEVAALKAQIDVAADSIRNAWDSQLQGLLSKTTTWGQAMRSIFAAVAMDAIKWAEKKAIGWVTGQIAETAATTSGAAARTAAEVTGQAAQTAAAVTGSTARSAAAVGEASASIGAKFTTMIASIIASAQETFAGVFAFLSPVMGPAAAGPAAASEAAVAAQAVLPGFASGAWELPSDMIAQVHKGEMIVPASAADAIRSGGGGGTSVVIYAMDARSVAAWAQDNAGALTGAVANYQKNNPSSRPRF